MNTIDRFMTRIRVYLLMALVAWFVLYPNAIFVLGLPPEFVPLLWVGLALWLWAFFVWARPRRGPKTH